MRYYVSCKRERTTVEINVDLETRVSSPVDGSIQHVYLALNEGLSLDGSDGPISDWNADMGESGSFNAIKVLLVDVGVPMQLEALMGTLTESRAECPFIHCAVASFFKDTGCDPWFQHQPSSQVNTADEIVSSSR